MVAFARPRVESRRPLAVVRLQGAGRTWEVLGSDTARGLVAEGLVLTADTHGPQTAGFRVKRDPAFLHPDLGPFAACDVEIGGVPVWSGRVWETPGSRGEERSMAVSGRGWQSHLEDDVIQRLYAHQRMSDYRDIREADPLYDLANHRQGPVVRADGNLHLVWPHNTPVAFNDVVHCVFDAGAATIRRAIIVWERIGVNAPDMTLYSRGSDTLSGATGDDATAVQSSASGTISHTFSANRRYHHIFVYYGGAGGTFGVDQGVRITAVRLFGSASWESGGSSILKASDVVKDVRAGAPLLSSDESAIEASTFAIPHLWPQGYRAPRGIIEAVNAYHDWLWGVDPRRRLSFRPRPSVPLYEVGDWSGSTFDDQSTGSAESLYNRVIVEGQGPAGETIHVARTATSPILDRHGLTRTKVLQVGAVLTTASAEAIGDAWLAEHARSQMRGSLRLVGMGGARRLTDGSPVHPAALLLAPGQRIRFANMVDPDTGGWGRDGTIASVSYDHDSETASVEIDNERGRFDALLARLGAIQEVTLT